MLLTAELCFLLHLPELPQIGDVLEGLHETKVLPKWQGHMALLVIIL